MFVVGSLRNGKLVLYIFKRMDSVETKTAGDIIKNNVWTTIHYHKQDYK